MKHQIFAFLMFTSFLTLNAQTKVDSILFDMINKYRQEHNLSPFVWEAGAFKMAQHHSEYLSLLDKKMGITSGIPITDTMPNILSHNENYKLEGIVSLKTTEDRFKLYCPNRAKQGYSHAENAITSMPEEKTSDFDIAKDIFDRWKKSKYHNKNMLVKNNKIIYAACSYKDASGTTKVKIKDKIFENKMRLGFCTLDILIYAYN